MNDVEAPVQASVTDHFVCQIRDLKQEALRCGFHRLAQSLELAEQMARFTIEERKRLHAVKQWRPPQT